MRSLEIAQLVLESFAVTKANFVFCCRILGLGVRVWVQDPGTKVLGLGFRAFGSGFRVTVCCLEGFGSRI